ncbi:2-dehydropantoate 2-reductase [Streptomyces sp. NBC_01186]|uniref:2-dehydropantoate 2-reductase n=1 Tax=unclassified Streptomyces TaxID=2593676 RepID=UPI002DDBEF33|nr:MULTISPECIES: 2-dehydropantoate 2-reductase [unclassified Streptomyces]WSB75576.1 2-dehydropantoate 2-reductase [Streptomyces sp. NBC_01775]WSS16138.1 2-dehydropantoate 2-reductase [Streptomyces sp. NBC_01186]
MTADTSETSDVSDVIIVVGGGAIGGTLAHALVRAGRPVTLIDADPAHVAALRAHGLRVLRPDGGSDVVEVDARTPEEFDGPPLRRVLLAVKAQATEKAIGWIAPRLAADGFVVSVQNGFNEPLIAQHIGAERTVAAFVNIFADVQSPGVIRDGGPGALVLGEVGGAPAGERVRELVEVLRPGTGAVASDNVEGYLWAKAGFGAMLAVTALADDAMADLIDRHRPAMYAAAREVFDVADALGIRLEPFDAFEALAFRAGAGRGEREEAAGRLTAWLRTQAKDRSGIWRDLAVRHRPVEVTTHYETVFQEAAKAGVGTPVLREVIAGLRELEGHPERMAESRLDALDRLAEGGRREAPALPGRALLTEEQTREVHTWLEARQEDMVADLAAYTALESPSDDPAALEACLTWLRGWLDDALGAPQEEELLPRDGAGDILLRRYAATGPGERGVEPPLLLLCHYDTVWPAGTLAEWPFTREGDVLSGPGVFDMKGGLVQLVWALRALDALGLPRPACTLLLNGDEETGSLASSEAIAAEARRSRAALVFEASADGGALKTARKGVGLFRLTVHGEEAHAGLDPTAGASAVHEAAHQTLRLAALADHDAGTSVNVGVLHGGTRSNVTAGEAVADLDVRVAHADEQRRIADALAALEPALPGTRLTLTGGWNRPVFERTPEVAALYDLAHRCAAPLGLDLREASVGGASDGNFAQSAGTPVLDGLGAVGGGAHARSEHATVSGMVTRSALAAALLASFTG